MLPKADVAFDSKGKLPVDREKDGFDYFAYEFGDVWYYSPSKDVREGLILRYVGECTDLSLKSIYLGVQSGSCLYKRKRCM